MTSPSPNSSRTLMRWLLLTMILVVGGGLFARDAYASCGDYLTVAGRNGTLHAMGSVSEDLLSLANEIGSSAHPFRQPCSGPNCGKQHPVPSPPVPVSFSVLDQELSAWLMPSDGGSPEICSTLLPFGRVPVDGFPSSLKRPPRGEFH